MHQRSTDLQHHSLYQRSVTYQKYLLHCILLLEFLHISDPVLQKSSESLWYFHLHLWFFHRKLLLLHRFHRLKRHKSYRPHKLHLAECGNRSGQPSQEDNRPCCSAYPCQRSSSGIHSNHHVHHRAESADRTFQQSEQLHWYPECCSTEKGILLHPQYRWLLQHLKQWLEHPS